MADLENLTKEEIEKLAREGYNAYMRDYYRRKKERMKERKTLFWAKRALDSREENDES